MAAMTPSLSLCVPSAWYLTAYTGGKYRKIEDLGKN